MSRQCLTTLLLPGLLALSLVGNAQTTQGANPIALKPGKPVTQALQSGQTFEYQVPLKAGEALKATVEQKGIDVVVTAYAPDGTKLGTFDSPTASEYKEFVSVAATKPGNYRLAVSGFEPKAPAGTFVMSLDRIMTPAQYAQSQAEDRKRAETVTAYLQTPHPNLTSAEQRAELLKLDPAVLMPVSSPPEATAARWLEGTWTATTKRYATPYSAEINLPASNRALRFDPKTPTLLQVDADAKGKFVPFMAFEPRSRQWVQAYLDAGDGGTAWSLLKGHDWQNNQLVLEGESAEMGITAHHRLTWTKTDNNNMHLLTEDGKADGTWVPVAETHFARAKAPDVSAK